MSEYDRYQEKVLQNRIPEGFKITDPEKEDARLRAMQTQHEEWAEQAEAEKLKSLRDQFAMAALTGIIIRGECHQFNMGVDAYAIADAMLKAREVKK